MQNNNSNSSYLSVMNIHEVPTFKIKPCQTSNREYYFDKVIKY